jgi:hypothetical protein
MNFSELHRQLIAAARATPPDGGVPYRFEKRIMARLAAGRAAADPMALWSRALGRAAALCFVVMLLVTAGSLFLPRNSESLTQAVEKTLLAAVEGGGNESPSGDMR